jgi:hypothetical protein
MSDTENWKLQVSYKISNGDMINIRAHTADELSVLLENISDYATQIAATQRALSQAGTVAPLSTSSSTAGTTPPPYSTPTQAAPPFATAVPVTEAPAAGGPVCIHGPRKYKSGISSKTGNPYAMWVCTQPQGAGQCKPVN